MTKVLGLDVGGTNCRALLAQDGRPHREASSSSASLTAVGPQRAAAALADLLAQLDLRPGAGLDAICVGTAGTGGPEVEEFFVSRLCDLASGPVRVVNDARLVLAAAGVAEGIACVSGTGSIVVGLVGETEVVAGGWGYLLGDEGSGYWVVREAVRELLTRHDAGVPTGALGVALHPAWHESEVHADDGVNQGHQTPAGRAEIMDAWYEGHSPGRWAAHAPAVLDLAGQDPFATQLLQRAARALATTISEVYARLGQPPGLPVVLSGGLLSGHQGLGHATSNAVRAAAPGTMPQICTAAPVTGAVKTALAIARQSR